MCCQFGVINDDDDDDDDDIAKTKQKYKNTTVRDFWPVPHIAQIQPGQAKQQ